MVVVIFSLKCIKNVTINNNSMEHNMERSRSTSSMERNEPFF